MENELAGFAPAQAIDLSIFDAAAPGTAPEVAVKPSIPRKRRTYSEYQTEIADFDAGDSALSGAVGRGAARSLIGQAAGLSGAAEIPLSMVGKGKGAQDALKGFGDRAEEISSQIPSLSFEEAFASPKLLPQYIGEAVGNVIGFMGPMLVSAPLSAANKVVGTAGKVASALKATTPYVAATSSGDVFREVRQTTGKEAPKIALAAGITQGLLEKFGAEKMLSSILSSQVDDGAKKYLLRELFTKETMRRLAPSVAKAGGTAALGEGGTEALQEAVSVAANKVTGGSAYDAVTAGNGMRLLEAFAGGVAGSLPFAGAAGGRKVYDSYLSNKDFAEAMALGRSQAQQSSAARLASMQAAQGDAATANAEMDQVRQRVDAAKPAVASSARVLGKLEDLGAKRDLRSRMGMPSLDEGLQNSGQEDAQPAPATPPVKEGFVRMYHGGVDPRGQVGGDRDITQYPQYAAGYAEKGGSTVWYVDVPESAPFMKKGFEEFEGGMKAPWINAKLPAEYLKLFKPLPRSEWDYKDQTGRDVPYGMPVPDADPFGDVASGPRLQKRDTARMLLARRRLGMPPLDEGAASSVSEIGPTPIDREVEGAMEASRKRRSYGEAPIVGEAQPEVVPVERIERLSRPISVNEGTRRIQDPQSGLLDAQLEADALRTAEQAGIGSASVQTGQSGFIPTRGGGTPRSIESLAPLSVIRGAQAAEAPREEAPPQPSPEELYRQNIGPILERAQAARENAENAARIKAAGDFGKVASGVAGGLGRPSDVASQMSGGLGRPAEPARRPASGKKPGAMNRQQGVRRSRLAPTAEEMQAADTRRTTTDVSQTAQRGTGTPKIAARIEDLKFAGTREGPSVPLKSMVSEVGSTGSLQSLLLAFSRKSSAYRKVFEYLAAMSAGADGATFEIGRGADEFHYARGENVVRLLTSDGEIPERVLIHEAIHALTSRYISKFIYRAGGVLRGGELLNALRFAINDPTTPEPAKELVRLYLHAVSTFGLTDKLFSDSKNAVPATITAQVSPSGQAVWYSVTPEEAEIVSESLAAMGVEAQTSGGTMVAQFSQEQLAQLKSIGALRKSGLFSRSSNLVIPGVTKTSKPGLAGTSTAASGVFADGIQYGFSNLDEFLSEAMSNPEFQGMLNAIPAGNGTVWTRFLDILKSLFPFLRVNSLLSDVLRLTERVMEAQKGLNPEEGATPGEIQAPITSKRQLLDRIRLEARGDTEAETREATAATSQNTTIGAALAKAASWAGSPSPWALNIAGVSKLKQLLNEATSRAIVSPISGKQMSFVELASAKDSLPPFMKEWYTETARDTFVRHRQFEEQAGRVISKANRYSAAYESRIVKALENNAAFQAIWSVDPVAAAQTILNDKTAAMPKRVRRHLRGYLRINEARKILTEAVNDPAVRTEYQLSGRESGSGSLTPPVGRKMHSDQDFDTWSTLPTPDGGVFNLSRPTTKEETAKAITGLQGYLSQLENFILDNQDDPYVDFWTTLRNRLTNLQLSLMKTPGVAVSVPGVPGFSTMFRMIQTTLGKINTPAARQASVILGNLVAADEKAQIWQLKNEEVFKRASLDAAASHGMDKEEWVNSVWSQYSGLAQKIGGKLPVGSVLYWDGDEAVKVTQEDEAALATQVQGYSNLINDPVFRGREGVMSPRYVADKYGKGGSQVIYRPAFKRSDSTLPKVFAQRGVNMVTSLFGAQGDTESPFTRFQAMLPTGGSVSDADFLTAAQNSGVLSIIENNPDLTVSHFNNRSASIYSGTPRFEEAVYDEVATLARSEPLESLDDYAEEVSRITQGTDKEVTPERAKRQLLEELLEVSERANKYFTDNEKDLQALNGIKVSVMNLRSQNSFSLGRQEAKFPWFFWNFGYHSTVNLAQFSADARAQYFTDFYDNVRLMLQELDGVSNRLKEDIEKSVGPRASESEREAVKRARLRKNKGDVKSGADYVEWENLTTTIEEVKALLGDLEKIGKDDIKTEQRLSVGISRVMGDVVGATLANPMTGVLNITSVARDVAFLSRMANFSTRMTAELGWTAAKSVIQDLTRMAYGLASAIPAGFAGAARARGGIKRRAGGFIGSTLDQLINKPWLKDVAIAGMKLSSTQAELVKAGYSMERPINAFVDNYLDLAATRGRFETRTTIADEKWSKRLSSLASVYNLAIGLPIEAINQAIGPAMFDKIAGNASFRLGQQLIQVTEMRLKDIHRKMRPQLEPFINGTESTIPANLVIPRLMGVKAATNSELTLMEQFFTQGGLNLHEEVAKYWKTLDSDKSAKFLTDNQRAEMGVQMVLKENRPTIANRPSKLRTDLTMRLLLPIFGWSSSALNNTLNWMLRAKSDPKNSQAALRISQAIAIAGLMGAFSLGGWWSEWLRRLVLRLYGEKPMTKMPHEAADGAEASSILARYALSGLPIIGQAGAMMLNNGTATGGLGLDIFFAKKFEDLIRFADQAVKTRDPLNPAAMYRLAKSFFPVIRLIGSKFESVSGTVAVQGNKRLIQNYGPKDLVRDTGGTMRANIPYTEMSPLMDRMVNAAGNGNITELREAYNDAVAKAKELGKKTPEGYVRQLFSSRDPYKGALKSQLTPEQRDEMLRQMPDDYRAEFLETEKRFNEGYAAIGGTPRVAIGGGQAGGLSESYQPAAPSITSAPVGFGGGITGGAGSPVSLGSRRVRMASLPQSGGNQVAGYTPRFPSMRGYRAPKRAKTPAVRRSSLRVRRPRIAKGRTLGPRRPRL